MTTFGIEEEYVFLEPATLSPVALVEEAMAALGTVAADAEHVQHEFLTCQIERSTGICSSTEEALDELLAFRRQLGSVANHLGAIVASTGFAPGVLHEPVVSDNARYRSIKATSRGVIDEHFVNGLHVHVAVPNREAGIAAMNRIRVWMPTIVALAANSPIRRDAETGFASWRTLHFQRWSSHGCPPVFRDLDDHDRRLERLIGVGGSIDHAVLSFNVRLSIRHPTIEIRAADVQLEARESVVIAAIVRGLVETALDDALNGGEALRDAVHNDGTRGTTAIGIDPELLEASLWHAARDGLGDHLVDPRTGELRPAREVVEAMLESIDAMLARSGDLGTVHDGVMKTLVDGNGAMRQRSAFMEGGRAGLARRLSASFSRDDGFDLEFDGTGRS